MASSRIETRHLVQPMAELMPHLDITERRPRAGVAASW
jgi:hypothetical protein